MVIVYVPGQWNAFDLVPVIVDETLRLRRRERHAFDDARDAGVLGVIRHDLDDESHIALSVSGGLRVERVASVAR